MSSALQTELETFHRNLPALLQDEANVGQYALIHGDEVNAPYPTFDAALAAGYDLYQLSPFLVKQVVEREEPKVFSRYIRCPSSTARSTKAGRS